MYQLLNGPLRLSNLLYAIMVGVVQGISEWLPISSKTQVLLVSNYLFGLPVEVAFAFGLFMEVGSLASASAYFRRDIISLFHDRRLLLYLLVVTLFTGLIGVPLYVVAEKLLSTAYSPGIPMMILGAILVSDSVYIRYSRLAPRMAGLKDMRLRHYVAIGVAQGIAALPGVSRSGMTVSTMLFMGMEPGDAFRLSYLAYIPAALGGFATTILLSRAEINTAVTAVDPVGVVFAVVAAALVGLVVISAALRFAKRNNIYVVTLVIGVVAIVIGALATAASI
ncbi:MAG: undecaprenyl-diphosphatase [Nitrososphaerota archaeon]|nr:undecaprenyl-diphosphatase [Nitrososphaerota archaeon]